MPFTQNPYIFNPEAIASMKEEGGVYGITSGQLQMIYIGQSENLKRRLAEHHNDPKDCIWRYAPSRFYVEPVTGGEEARMKREQELIIDYSYPPCNK